MVTQYNGGHRTGEAQPYEPFTVTLKAGSDIGAPWVIVKADTAEQLQHRLSQLEKTLAMQTVARAAAALASAYECQKRAR